MLHCTTEINNTRRARATKEKEEEEGPIVGARASAFGCEGIRRGRLEQREGVAVREQ